MSGIPEDVKYKADLIASTWAVAECEEKCSSAIAQAIMAERLSNVQSATPIVWVIPGQDNARDDGFIDAMAWEWGEFSRPLYAHPPTIKPEGVREWRVFEDITHGWWGIEIAGDEDAAPLLYPKKLSRETLENIVRAHNDTLRQPLKMLVSNERLKEQILADDDDQEVEVRSTLKPEGEQAKVTAIKECIAMVEDEITKTPHAAVAQHLAIGALRALLSRQS